MKTFTITFDEYEMLAFRDIIDAGVRHAGAAAVKPAFALIQKLEAAQPDQPETEKETE